MMSPAATEPRISDRLIVALDVHSADAAKDLVQKLSGSACFYKIGLELFMSGGYFELLDWLVDRGNKVFVDLKFFDVPETVGAAVRLLSETRATFATVHGDAAIMRAAVANRGSLKILGVTALTSLDQQDVASMGYAGTVEDLVMQRAQSAAEAGCDGVIASPREAYSLKQKFRSLLVVTPGIRLEPGRPGDDQKRTATPEESLEAGADYIVMGRPIREAKDPRAAAMSVQREIEVRTA